MERSRGMSYPCELRFVTIDDDSLSVRVLSDAETALRFVLAD